MKMHLSMQLLQQNHFLELHYTKVRHFQLGR